VPVGPKPEWTPEEEAFLVWLFRLIDRMISLSPGRDHYRVEFFRNGGALAVHLERLCSEVGRAYRQAGWHDVAVDIHGEVNFHTDRPAGGALVGSVTLHALDHKLLRSRFTEGPLA